jgi:hypothetical protein
LNTISKRKRPGYGIFTRGRGAKPMADGPKHLVLRGSASPREHDLEEETARIRHFTRGRGDAGLNRRKLYDWH